MPVDPTYAPTPLFAALGPDFADTVAPARFPMHRLRWRNQRWADAVGLGGLTAAEWEAAFARFEPLPDNQSAPLAIRYHGHQFRVYNPDLGDGRGFLFAQLRDRDGRLLDLGTKGSGQTPWSRSGDGRLTLKGGVREVLAAAMLEAQGVYTSKAFALFETGEALERSDEPSPTRSSVLTRLSHGHVRFGVFQRHAFHNRPDLIRTLITYCGEVFYPEVLAADEAEQPAALLRAAVQASARLAAQWMAAGFVHGVLNTDNLTVTGESFDYGPWRFLPVSAPGFTAAYFDHSGLYAFGRQPEAVSWALAQFAGALTLVSETEPLEEALRGYAPAYQAALRTAMFTRLGIATGELRPDLEFLQAFFNWLTESEAGWAQTFHDWFCGAASADRAAASPQAALYAAEAFAPIRAGFLERAPVRPERLGDAYFTRPTPADLLIDEVEALWAPIAAADDWSAFDGKLAEIDAMRRALDIAHPKA
ncbi:MAG: YdiU family protein [Alphaproteobacteria bacterium]|nr:YdiU family protein [Alphaproteobacteria bacterium]